MLARFRHDMTDEEFKAIADTLNDSDLNSTIFEAQFFISNAGTLPDHHASIFALESDNFRKEFESGLTRTRTLHEKLLNYRTARFNFEMELKKSASDKARLMLDTRIEELLKQSDDLSPAQLSLLAAAKAIVYVYKPNRGYEYQTKVCNAVTNILNSTTANELSKNIDTYRVVMEENTEGKKRHTGGKVAGVLSMFLGAALVALGAFFAATIALAPAGALLIGLGVGIIIAGAFFYRHSHKRNGHEELLHIFDDRVSSKKFGIFAPVGAVPSSDVRDANLTPTPAP